MIKTASISASLICCLLLLHNNSTGATTSHTADFAQTSPHVSFLGFALLFLVILLLGTLLLISKRKSAHLENKLEQTIQNVKQCQKLISHLSLTSHYIQSDNEKKTIIRHIGNGILQHCDYKRMMISLFKNEYPHREIVAHDGLTSQEIEKISSVSLSKSYFTTISNLGVKIGTCSYYIPHTMKHIFNQESVIFGKGEFPEEKDTWHPEDNLLVHICSPDNTIIGIISVDQSKSGRIPTDEMVQSIEIYARFLGTYLNQKTTNQKVTDLKEQLIRANKMEAISNVTGTIVHDLNNILGVILGNTDLALINTREQSTNQPRLLEIKESGIKAKSIIQKLLSFSKSGDSRHKSMNIISALEEALDFIRSTIPSTITMVNNIHIQRAAILGDAAEIYQVMLDLCTNASDAMKEAGGTLTVSVTKINITPYSIGIPSKITDGVYIEINVTDTGTGIESEFLHRIFDAGYSSRNKGKTEGTGLHQVKQIIQDHNGWITVSSKINEGTSFSIFLPILEEVLPEKPLSSELKKGHESILFIDDDKSLLSLGVTIMEELGYKVSATSDPLNGLELYSKSPKEFDLVITDMTMPKMTGDLLAEKLLNINPNAKIILCTGYSDKISHREARQLGIKGYYEKPLTIQTFSSAIRKVLDV